MLEAIIAILIALGVAGAGTMEAIHSRVQPKTRAQEWVDPHKMEYSDENR